MKLSLCITTYNRYEMTIESFAKVIDDPRIDDIVIMDDGSTDEIWQRLFMELDGKSDNIRFFHKKENVGMSRNKREAIAAAKNEWCILFDSDNIIDTDYLDAFYKYVGNKFNEVSNEYRKRTIFCPDFAKPKFDYTVYSQSGMPIFTQWNAGAFIVNDDFNCLMNTCNYIVNRDFYLNTYQHNPQHIASDTIWHNYNHLKAGGNFHVVPGMQYFHRVHDGSGFMQDAAGNMARAAEVRKLIQSL